MREMCRVRALAVVSLVMACLLAGHGLCYAALGVKPESIELVAGSDTITDGVYNVVNEGSETVRVSVQPEEWPRLAVRKESASVDKWLTVTPREFDLAPQEQKEVRFTVDSPSGREAELSAMIFFATTSPEGMMNITTRNGVSLYVAFADNMLLECLITGIKISRLRENTAGGTIDRGIVFTVNFENKGNVHIRPAGSIAITGPDGSKYDVDMARGFPAYAGGKGSYQVLWDKQNIAPGKYDALITLDYGRLFNLDGKVYKKASFVVNNDGSVSS